MKFSKILSLVAAMFVSGCCCSKASNPNNVEVVSPHEFQSRLSDDSQGYLLDVRKPQEFAAGHLRGAHLLDWLDTENFKKDAPGIDKSKTVYIYCRSGRRSNAAANYLSKLGYTGVDMDGGILAWEKEELPVTTDHQ